MAVKTRKTRSGKSPSEEFERVMQKLTRRRERHLAKLQKANQAAKRAG